MPTPILLVATTTASFGTARIPRALARAGFEVSLLTPRGALAEKSRYVARFGYLPDAATVGDFLAAFASMVASSSPRIVVPCDDMAFRLLAELVRSPPDEMPSTLRLQLAGLVRESLGDPTHYATSVDQTLLPPAAEALGIRVPRYAIVAGPRDAEAFTRRNGYPVVLKRSHGIAGEGAALCSGATELAQAFAEFAQSAARDPAEPGGRYLLQAPVHGTPQYLSLAAWKGVVVAGWAADGLVCDPAPKGAVTVVGHRRSPEVREFAERIVRGFGASGLLNLECAIERGTGVPYLVEVSRRVNPGIHRGSWVGVDLCAALYAAVQGLPWTSRNDMGEGEERIAAHFPQEWLRDPESRFLRDCPVDVPWDEPELIEAMLALRNAP